jgi:hypothetical protein
MTGTMGMACYIFDDNPLTLDLAASSWKTKGYLALSYADPAEFSAKLHRCRRCIIFDL